MADFKIIFVAVAATLLICQMVSARPDDATANADDSLSLKNVEASVSIAVDDVKKNLQELAKKAEKVLTDLRNAAQSNETQSMLNNWNEQLTKLADNVKTAAKDLSERIQANIPAAAPSS